MSFKQTLQAFLKDNWGSPFIVAFLVCLIYSAAASAFIESNVNDIEYFALYSLGIGIFLQFVSYVRTVSQDKVMPQIFRVRDRIFFVAVIWFLISITGIPFGRIYDSEVVNLLVSQQIRISGPHTVNGIVFFPQLLVASISKFNNIEIARVIPALFLLGTAFLLLKWRNYDNFSFLSAIIYLSSFYVLRYGFRYLADPVAAFFVILGVFLFLRQRFVESGIVSGIALFSSLAALPLVPVLLFFLLRRNQRSVRNYLTGLFPIMPIGIIWSLFSSFNHYPVYLQTILNGSSIAPELGLKNLPLAVGEFILFCPILVFGLIWALSKRRYLSEDNRILLILFAAVALTDGLLIGTGVLSDGDLFIVTVISCPIASYALLDLVGRSKNRARFSFTVIPVVLIAILVSEFYFSPPINFYNSYGVQDTGYATDQALLNFLDSNYHGGKIYSTSALGLLDPALQADWTWLQSGLTVSVFIDDPQWLIVPYSSIVVLSNPQTLQLFSAGQIVAVGSYVIIERNNYTLSQIIQLN